MVYIMVDEILINIPFSFCLAYSRYHYPVPKIFYVQLSVGSHEFIGEGRTRQAARHNAAMKALQALRNEPIPERPPQVQTHIPTTVWKQHCKQYKLVIRTVHVKQLSLM